MKQEETYMKLKGTFYMKNGMIIEKTVDGGFSQRSVDNFLDSYRVYLTKKEDPSFLFGNLRLDATQIIAMNVDLV